MRGCCQGPAQAPAGRGDQGHLHRVQLTASQQVKLPAAHTHRWHSTPVKASLVSTTGDQSTPPCHSDSCCCHYPVCCLLQMSAVRCQAPYQCPHPGQQSCTLPTTAAAAPSPQLSKDAPLAAARCLPWPSSPQCRLPSQYTCLLHTLLTSLQPCTQPLTGTLGDHAQPVHL